VGDGRSLAFLIAVTFSAGFIKIFSPDPRSLPGRRAQLRGEDRGGGHAPADRPVEKTVHMNQVDAVVAGLFLLFVAVDRDRMRARLV